MNKKLIIGIIVGVVILLILVVTIFTGRGRMSCFAGPLEGKTYASHEGELCKADCITHCYDEIRSKICNSEIRGDTCICGCQ